jgi:anti-sigma-K factor RskA
MMTEVEVIEGQLDLAILGADKLKAISDEIKDDENFKKLLQQWQQASKIRMWIVEKKNNLSEKLQRSTRATYIE